MSENIVVEKSFAFATRIVYLYKFLTHECNEYTMSRQLLKCGTSIGANVHEAQKGQSKRDFAAKMNIALKEASETEYWLCLLNVTDYLDDKQFNSMYKDVDELISILTAICKTASADK